MANFWSVLAEFNVDVQYIKSTFNLASDFHSRNLPTCNASTYQVCQFVTESDTSVVHTVSIDSALAGHHPVPFSSRATWKNLQMNCPDLRRVHAHLSQGTRPTNQMVKVTLVKRYLHKVTISKDGLLVVQHSQPFLPEKELIVILQNVLPGIITCLHLRFNHPSPPQLQKLFHRSFYALNEDACVSSVCTACSQCQSLRTVPKELSQPHL